MIKSFDNVMNEAKKGKPKRLAVADAAGEAVIEALKEATRLGMIQPLLIGEREKIEPIVEKVGLSSFEFFEAKNPTEIASLTISLVRDGNADMLMKGKLPTPVLLKAVLDKEKGLRTGSLLSHIAATEVEGKYPKLMLFTDGGMNIKPDAATKAKLITNAVGVAKKLGIDTPKVAVLTAIETINPDMPETMDAALLVKMADRGQLGKVIVEGPIAMDVVLSKAAARAKKIETPIAEDADIFLVPDIASGNIAVKALIYLADALVGGIVVGAKAPIVLLSRSDTAEIKLASIALACVVS